MKFIYKKWWFWLIILAVVYGSYWLYDDYNTEQEFQISIAPYLESAKEAKGYMKYVLNEKERTDEMLRNDTYGGETPEETLRLFVEALEAGDAGLASKYYLPWEQDDAEGEMRDWVKDESLDKFITAYHDGIVKKGDRAVNAAMKIYPTNDDIYHYTIEMEQNKETNLWKITEF